MDNRAEKSSAVEMIFCNVEIQGSQFINNFSQEKSANIAAIGSILQI